MADAADSKSAARECVRVRVPPPAPFFSDRFYVHDIFLLLFALGELCQSF